MPPQNLGHSGIPAAIALMNSNVGVSQVHHNQFLSGRPPSFSVSVNHLHHHQVFPASLTIPGRSKSHMNETKGPSTLLSPRNELSILEAESHQQRLAIQDGLTSGKGTEVAYARHVKNYKDWWLHDQNRRMSEAGSTWKEMIPAHPITAAKVALFLHYEMMRPKKSAEGKEITGSRISCSSLSQCLSALEQWRFNHQHEKTYKQCPESHIKLCDDHCIKMIETGARATEPERVTESQELKAFGVLNDTYNNQEELVRASVWALSQGQTPSQIHKSMRDRSMNLTTTSVAFRGDNLRHLLWSDIFCRDIPMPELGPDFKVLVVVFLSYQGKTNTEGRIDEQASFRHRIPELCCVGALAFYFFSQFHIEEELIPSFEPDFQNEKSHGKIGFRQWYQQFLFPGKDAYSPMSYDNHRKRVNFMKLSNDLQMQKVTHAGRTYAALTTRDHRATQDDLRALGGWSKDIVAQSYDRSLPIEGMLAAASFNAQRPESFFIACDILDPPAELLAVIFPWVENEQRALAERCRTIGHAAKDSALSSFLNLLIRLRHILPQDVAVLALKHPKLPFLNFAPFNTLQFREFALSSSAIIKCAEDEAHHRLETLPETLATSMRGILMTASIQNERNLKGTEDLTQMLASSLGNLSDSLGALLQANLVTSTKKKRKALEAALMVNSVRAPPALRVPDTQLLINASSPHPPPISTTNPVVSPQAHTSPGSITISLSGKMHPSAVFSLSVLDDVRREQLTTIAELEERFTAERLQKHTFMWTTRKNSEGVANEWLPNFERFWKLGGRRSVTVEEIWKEYQYGMDGCLSISQLNMGWHARWKRDIQGIKTEYSRRMKIINVIQALANPKAKLLPHPDAALLFLSQTYPITKTGPPHLRTTRAFIEWLQKDTSPFLNSDGIFKSAFDMIMDDAHTFKGH